MSSVLRSLLVKVGVDLTDAQKGFKQAAREFKSQGKELSQIGRTMTTGITLPVLGAAAASIKYASDMEESMNKVNVAFKDSAGEVTTWSDSALKSFGIAKGTALDMAATFGDMGTAMGLVPAEAATMSTSLAGLAGDLASFKNIDIGQASDALRGVFTGEGEALKTLGIIMQDSTLQAYALANGYKKSYKDMSQGEKVTLRYKYVMEATSNAQGDFARTSDGVANQMRIAQEQLKQTAATLGSNLLPQAAKALKGINGLVEGFAGLSDEAQQNIIIAAGVAAAIGPVIMMIGKLNTGIAGLMTGAASAAKAISGGAGIVGAIGAMIGPAGVVTLAVIAIGALVAGLAIAYSQSNDTAKEIKALNKQVEETEKKFNASNAEIETNATLAKKLSDELYALNDKEKKTNTEKAKMVELTNQLNKLMPDLNLEIDKQTYALNKTKKAVEDLIVAKKNELKLRASEDKLLELYKLKLDASEKLKVATKAEADAYRDLMDAANNPNTTMAQQSGFALVYEDAKAAADALRATNSELDTSIASIESSYGDLTAAVVATTDAIGESGEEAVQLTEEQLAEQQKQFEEYMQRFSDLRQQHLDNMGGLDDQGIEKMKLTAAEVKANLEAQIKDFQAWQGSIATLSGRIPADVSAGLRELGPSALPLIQELNTMTNEELEDWVGVWQQKSKAAADAAKLELDVIPLIGTETTDSLANSLVDGLDEHADMVNQNFADSGRFSGTSYDEGLKEKLALIELTAKNNAMSAKEQMMSEAAGFKEAGALAGTGFADGLREKRAEIMAVARSIARDVQREMELALEIHSPSRVTMRIGAFVGEGLVKGLAAQSQNVKGAALGLSDALSSGLNPDLSYSMSASTRKMDLQSTTVQSNASVLESQFNQMVQAVRLGLEGMGIYQDNREVARMIKKANTA